MAKKKFQPSSETGLSIPEEPLIAWTRLLAARHASAWGAPPPSEDAFHEYLQRIINLAESGQPPSGQPAGADKLRAVAARVPGCVMERLARSRDFTAIHQISPDEAPDSTGYRLFSQRFPRLAWPPSPWLGAYELAERFVLDTTIEERRRIEFQALRQYCHTLYDAGVRYSVDLLLDDYRLSINMLTVVPIACPGVEGDCPVDELSRRLLAAYQDYGEY